MGKLEQGNQIAHINVIILNDYSKSQVIEETRI